jgi:FAD/FMN-containing dehydrogenase
MHTLTAAALAAALALLASAQDAPAAAAAPAAQAAPAHCLRLSTDADWPAKATWDAELPGWEKLGATAMGPNAGNRHPDVKYEVKRAASVARALAFAKKHRVRLAIINSGHDFPARNDAPSGILLDVGGMKGVRVVDGFVPTVRGAEGVDWKTVTNVVSRVEGREYAATFGAGVSYAELNKELAKSGLWTIGAAHGMPSPLFFLSLRFWG